MTEKEVFESIKFHKLKRCAEFDILSTAAFARIYNGYGPDAWPASIRDAVTWVFGNFREIPGVHDVEFFYSDGTRSGFNETCRHWKANCSIMLEVRYPLSSPTLWIHRAVAWGKLRLAYKAISGTAAYRFYIRAGKKNR